MSNRYNTLDVVVGVGMCAIVSGALFLFLAVNGTYHVVPTQTLTTGQPATSDIGMSLLQPAFGRAIVDQVLSERRDNQAVAQSVSEWNRATIAFHDFVSGSGSALGPVMRNAQTVPAITWRAWRVSKDVPSSTSQSVVFKPAFCRLITMVQCTT